MRVKHCVIALLVAAILAPGVLLAKGGGKSGSKSSSSGGTVHVKGYYRKDGTYVRPHTRSAPGSGSHYSAPSSRSYTPPPDSPRTTPRYFDQLPPFPDEPTTEKPSASRKKRDSSSAPGAGIGYGIVAKGDTVEGEVVGVTDGDTITLLVGKMNYRIRLDGIDAPEKDQPFGNQAKKALSDKVFGKTVRMLSKGQDRYGRTLGIVYSDGCVNTAMVREGWAWHYKHFVSSPILAKAEDGARAARAGLWVDGKPTPPWEWRHDTSQKPPGEAVGPSAPFTNPSPRSK